MGKLKEILVGSLGIVGFLLWYLIAFAVLYIPFLFLNLPFWIEFIIIFAMMNIPFVGSLIELATWIWALFATISKPINGWSIFYFVAFTVYCLPPILRIIITTIDFLIALIAEKFKK